MSEETHTPTPWAINGPVTEGIFGKPETMRDAGHGIRSVEPAQFGGKIVVMKGLKKMDAEFIVRACNNYERMKAALARASTIIKDGAVVFALKEHDHALKELQSIDALLAELNKETK